MLYTGTFLIQAAGWQVALSGVCVRCRGHVDAGNAREDGDMCRDWTQGEPSPNGRLVFACFFLQRMKGDSGCVCSLNCSPTSAASWRLCALAVFWCPATLSSIWKEMRVPRQRLVPIIFVGVHIRRCSSCNSYSYI